MPTIRRITDIERPLVEALEKRGRSVEKAMGAFLRVSVGEKIYVIDNKDHSGPVMLSNLRGWIDSFDRGDHLILLTMGFFHPRCYQYLIDEKILSRIALIGIGLRDFYDEEAKATAFGEVEGGVFDAVVSVLGDRGIDVDVVTCKYCGGRVVAYCCGCSALLCKSHFIQCPLCKATLCHTDVSDCYYKHEC
ncbi:MAG TPA: hypothetical protein ENG29_02880 [Firmicutes bacterium]|nr:hypothetical protein [Bacillota bacterium]HEC80318.1 hypothetical protein [Bacillota bacterium]